MFYLSTDTFVPSPWLKFPASVLLDRTGTVRDVLEQSAHLPFPPVQSIEVSRVLSKALAGTHEVVRRPRRGELVYAQSLLEELRSHMIRLDECLHASDPVTSAELKVDSRISAALRRALEASYVSLDRGALESAVVRLTEVLVGQIPRLHAAFELARRLENDLDAAALVSARQIA